MPGKHHVGERLRSRVRLAPQVPAAEEEFARRNLEIDPDGTAPVQQPGCKELGGKAFGQLLGVDEGIGDLLAVVKHFGLIEGGGIQVCGPEDNRHTAECTATGAVHGKTKGA